MPRGQKIIWFVLAAIILVTAAGFMYKWLRRARIKPVSVVGAVLRQDTDPKKQAPIANAKVTVTSELSRADSQSDASGLFTLTLLPGVERGQPITLRFEHPEYKPLEITEVPKDQLYIIRMEPLNTPAPPVAISKRTEVPTKEVRIKDVRVRYPVKSQTSVTVGSVAKQFEVVNKGNIPCQGRPPCSPDGKWKATIGTLSLDAQETNEFRNVRVSCIAGPCPFTRIQPYELSRGGRTLNISVLNWSDPASFLVEAEVMRTMETDTVRWSYPFITGQTMSFALPAASEGPVIEAALNGEEIVFPLGPSLNLSWASCNVETAPGHNRLYRCELKPGYQFQ
jgi:hypothetical protein